MSVAFCYSLTCFKSSLPKQIFFVRNLRLNVNKYTQKWTLVLRRRNTICMNNLKTLSSYCFSLAEINSFDFVGYAFTDTWQLEITNLTMTKVQTSSYLYLYAKLVVKHNIQSIAQKLQLLDEDQFSFVAFV